MLLIVIVLDPRSKQKHMNLEIDELFQQDRENGLKLRLKSTLKSLFKYNAHRERTQDDTYQVDVNIPTYKIYSNG